MFFLLFCIDSILDDIEMYEQQTPFELSDYVGLSYFLNNFLYRAIQENVFGETFVLFYYKLKVINIFV